MTKTKKLTVLLSIILMLVLSIFGVVLTSSIPQASASADEITSENFPDTSTWTKTEYNGEPVGGKIIRLEGDLETYADFICVGPSAMHFVSPDRTADKVRLVCTTMSGSVEWELPHAFGEGFVDVYFPYANFSVLDASVPMAFYSRTDGGFFGDFFDASFGNGKAYIMSNDAAGNASALPEGMAAELNLSLHAIGGRTFRVYKNETFAVTEDCPNLINIQEGSGWYVQLNTAQGTATLMHSLAGAVYYFSVDVNTEEYYEFDIPAITVTATNEALDGGKEDLNLAEAHWLNDEYGTVTDAYFVNGGSLYSMVTPTADGSEEGGQTPTPEEPKPDEPEVPGDKPETPSDDKEKPSVGDWIDNKLDSVSDFLSEYTGYPISAGLIIIAIIVIILIKKK